ncbi:hypothetical protein FUAX_07570 [Fulvitalea axinellae]|uniref:Uncharacterized protein n=1 Tax=Fulvitalea axinellae TaxID=1182444 RepID=A0AAU9D7Y2_9BACT|nr:hypothetical protein FUAX_07570 [Fulvitalea axinellae]
MLPQSQHKGFYLQLGIREQPKTRFISLFYVGSRKAIYLEIKTRTTK